MTAAAEVARVFREEQGRILASLIGVVRDFQLAEEALQDALLRALDRWPREGIPDNPAAWITRSARNRAIVRGISRCRSGAGAYVTGGSVVYSASPQRRTKSASTGVTSMSRISIAESSPRNPRSTDSAPGNPRKQVSCASQSSEAYTVEWVSARSSLPAASNGNTAQYPGAAARDRGVGVGVAGRSSHRLGIGLAGHRATRSGRAVGLRGGETGSGGGRFELVRAGIGNATFLTGFLEEGRAGIGEAGLRQLGQGNGGEAGGGIFVGACGSGGGLRLDVDRLGGAGAACHRGGIAGLGLGGISYGGTRSLGGVELRHRAAGFELIGAGIVGKVRVACPG